MKRFYYKVENTTKNPSIYGGRKQQATIYQIKKGELVYLGETRVWSTASYMGADGEVNNWLLENKIIPKKWSINYENTYTRYYVPNDKYSIRGI